MLARGILERRKPRVTDMPPAVKSKPARRIQILLIEDNPGDVRLTEEALRHSGADCSLTSVKDPETALAMLRGDHPSGEKLRPELIFLDLNLPKLHGLELIDRIRNTPGIEHVPIVILSSSQNPDEVRSTYKCGANCFVRKPNELDDFIRFMSTCYQFWCHVAVLPPN